MAAGTTLWRIVWPERGPLSAAIGGIVGLLCDFGGFLANIASPRLLLWPIAALAAVFFWMCLGRVRQAAATLAVAQENPEIGCTQCNLFRVLLFASVGLGALVLAGQGTTATERIGTQLGLIQQDVAVIREDTRDIKEDVAVIRDGASGVEIVRSPSSARDFFHNAWVYNNVRRDSDKAWETLEELYRRHAPNKLDAAELYASVGKAHLTGQALNARMLQVGRERGDAAMLVVAARSLDKASAAPVYAEARTLDPGLPFAHSDVSRTDHFPNAVAFDSTALRGMRDGMREAGDGFQQFLDVASAAPVAGYFYLPQHQPDYEAMVRGMLDMARRTQASYEQMLGQRLEVEARMKR